LSKIQAQVQIGPQPGPQSQFLSTFADIAIYGGSAGGGKTWAILIEPLRHVALNDFYCVIFRRTSPEITNPGGLWDESYKLYPMLKAKPRQTDLKWTFPSGSSIRFAHMEHEKDAHNWQGSQIPLIQFDELTHFTESQFFYLLSRNRSLSGVKPYVRATCNPDATSWVKDFLAPWLDKTYPFHAASGEILYMVRDNGIIHWYRTQEEAEAEHSTLWNDVIRPEHVIKSVTFIAATIYDNKILLKENPEYLGNLMALPAVERARLLDGDWDALPEAGKVLNRSWFEIVNAYPESEADWELKSRLPRRHEVRFWDFAATEKKIKGGDPDWTVGTKLVKIAGDKYYVADVIRGRWSAGDLDREVKAAAQQDGPLCPVRWEEEGGSSGKIAGNHFVNLLDGYDARAVRPQGDKVKRAMPFGAQAEAGNVKLIRAAWNDAWLVETHHFPDTKHDDQVDSAASAYTYLLNNAADITYGPSIW
jgi:predicted phage terminase large subunit-like protein